MLRGPRPLSEVSKHLIRRDIFLIGVPNFRPKNASRAMVVSLHPSLAQPIFFSYGCKAGFPQKFFAMWHTTLDAEGPPADILKLRATPPASRSSVVERFFYMGYATAGTRGA
jgi:hypothetical protein